MNIHILHSLKKIICMSMYYILVLKWLICYLVEEWVSEIRFSGSSIVLRIKARQVEQHFKIHFLPYLILFQTLAVSSTPARTVYHDKTLKWQKFDFIIESPCSTFLWPISWDTGLKPRFWYPSHHQYNNNLVDNNNLSMDDAVKIQLQK